MRRPPSLALAILTRFGPSDESLVGDLLQELGAGRSRGWFWWQVLSAVWLDAVRYLVRYPMRTTGGVAIGWTVLLLLFGLLGDAIADGVAGLLWGWDRRLAYAGEQSWRPFTVCAAFVSYGGFALSGWSVARLNRRNPAVLLAYAATVLVAVAASAVVIEVLIQRWVRVPVPHTLFYLVSVGLPHHWRSGLLLAPVVTLLGGLAAGRVRGFHEPEATNG